MKAERGFLFFFFKDRRNYIVLVCLWKLSCRKGKWIEEIEVIFL